MRSRPNLLDLANHIWIYTEMKRLSVHLFLLRKGASMVLCVLPAAWALCGTWTDGIKWEISERTIFQLFPKKHDTKYRIHTISIVDERNKNISSNWTTTWKRILLGLSNTLNPPSPLGVSELSLLLLYPHGTCQGFLPRKKKARVPEYWSGLATR